VLDTRDPNQAAVGPVDGNVETQHPGRVASETFSNAVDDRLGRFGSRLLGVQ
jgi:hypothetical protein